MIFVVALSLASNALWGMKQEHSTERPVMLLFRPDATIAGFGAENNISRSVLHDAFGLKEPADLSRRVSDLGLSDEEIAARVRKATAMGAEYGSKNWVKIPIKLTLWVVMVVVGLLTFDASRAMNREALIEYLERFLVPSLVGAGSWRRRT